MYSPYCSFEFHVLLPISCGPKCWWFPAVGWYLRPKTVVFPVFVCLRQRNVLLITACPLRCMYLFSGDLFILSSSKLVWTYLLRSFFSAGSVGASLASSGVPLRRRLRALLAERSKFYLISCSALYFCLCSFCQVFIDFSAASCKFYRLTWIFFLSGLGWHLPGISGGPTSTPPPCITCGTVQLFFDILLRLIIFVSARFARCCLTFQLLPANLVFLPTQF